MAKRKAIVSYYKGDDLLFTGTYAEAQKFFG